MIMQMRLDNLREFEGEEVPHLEIGLELFELAAILSLVGLGSPFWIILKDHRKLFP